MTYNVTYFNRATQKYVVTEQRMQLEDSEVPATIDKLNHENTDPWKVYGLRRCYFPSVRRWRTVDTTKESIPWY